MSLVNGKWVGEVQHEDVKNGAIGGGKQAKEETGESGWEGWVCILRKTQRGPKMQVTRKRKEWDQEHRWI